LTGQLIAFNRPLPCEQIPYIKLKQRVFSEEFAGQKAFIVGGSRGLGELLAKILSAGAADVVITYCNGREDAERVVKEITTGEGNAQSIQLDVLNIDGHSVFPKNWYPTHLYYMATPNIFEGKSGVFSNSLFEKFTNYYVKGFLNCIQAAEYQKSSIIKVFYPSSIAVTEIPIDMGEYAAAKQAGETLCQFIGKYSKDLKVYYERLPRLATDQTATMIPVENKDPIPFMLAVARRLAGL